MDSRPTQRNEFALSSRWRPFADAREFARSLGLETAKDWVAFAGGKLPELGVLPADIPRAPQRVYKKKGWVHWGDWLRTGTVAPRPRRFRPFEEAREFARSLGLRSDAEWRAFCRGDMPSKGTRPADIPTNPGVSYRDKGWRGLGDWLGTGNVAPQLRSFRPFDEAREFARTLGLRSEAEWMAFCRGEMPNKGTRPADIPWAPRQTYRHKGWRGLGDWLGTGTVALHLRVFRPFEEAREFAGSLNLRSRQEWREFCARKLPDRPPRPCDIPATPEQTYRDHGWSGYRDWLGTEDAQDRDRR